MTLRVVPELYCFDINVSKAFFTDILGFAIKYERPEEQFVYLTLDGVDLMLEGLSGQSRKWITGNPEFPLGRGMNFQWDVNDIERLYREVCSKSNESIYLALESKSYECGTKSAVQKQFIVQSPDGYLFRFCQDVR
ncbi:VOC family protein [Vibrio parahaemolyticus]|uniref:bleomycin resistance protein n=1 Tax=Vibrio parahaemolyticus TaxID=670 RepID=UPI001FA02258|nr:VOC family protein [Vibrio parahaemolyticus]EHR6739089.1 VOC family protein [Vibrio parahaemolyticus]MCS0079838.1 VOC family protein [Vibrio parahaemolyticus]HCH5095858.1 VOC family protein [Vibrio parahaemolyticus]